VGPRDLIYAEQAISDGEPVQEQVAVVTPSDGSQPSRGRHRQALPPQPLAQPVVSGSGHAYEASLSSLAADGDLLVGHLDPGRWEDSGPRDEPEPARGLWRLLGVRGWPLAAVLVVQAVLSLRLIWSTTAFIDEGEYLSVGHLELASLLHHTAIPDVSSYLSGSPLMYPPLAAIADNAGGLAGARLLSLAFMLLATVLLHGITRRLVSSRVAAFFAAALFIGIGPAQFLGAFATYDAMALALLALATWLGVRAVEASPAAGYALVCAGGVAVAAADATKYASGLFNPVVIAVTALAFWRARGRKAGLDAGGLMLLTAALLLTVGYDLSGSNYAAGISSTTLARSAGTDSVSSVLALSAHATAIIVILAALGAVVLTARRPGRPGVALAWTLVAAALLAPAEQARIHTLTSLFKHVGYGAWFACVIAGYLLAQLPGGWDRLAGWVRSRDRTAERRPVPSWPIAVGMVVALLAGAVGVGVADTQYGDWPDSRVMITDFGRLVRPGGVYLAEDPSVVTYYLRTRIPFQDVDSTFFYQYQDPQTKKLLTGAPAYAAAIKAGVFTGIVLSFGDTYVLDQSIVTDINASGLYRLVAVIRYRISYGPSKYEIWQRIAQ
jgi:hypothetical protein